MIRLVPIFLLLVAATAVFAVRHREAMLPLPDARTDRDEPTDVAVQLRKLTGSAAPQDKVWAQQFGEFVNTHPGRQWIVGRCDRPGLTEAEAARSARLDAVDQLYPLVFRQLPAGRLDRQWIRNRLRQDVLDGRLDADRCAEQFKRPYGTVWAESVLLDVSPDRIDPLTEQYAHQLHTHRAQMGRHAFFAGALVVVTALGYLLLNHLTRGYFSTRLRIAATAIAATCVLVLL
jgi:hypothetical protein